MTADAALIILMVELLAGVVLLAGILFFMSRKKQNREIEAIDKFISKFDEQMFLKNQPLEQLLTDNCGLDKQAIDNVLHEVSESERALLHSVIQFFLHREMALLSQIDQKIGQLSAPYQRLLSDVAAGKTKPDPTMSPPGLERINAQLVLQLDTAMKTIDEISAEYSRVFAGHQSQLELENSSKKMLQIFQSTIDAIKHHPKQ